MKKEDTYHARRRVQHNRSTATWPSPRSYLDPPNAPARTRSCRPELTASLQMCRVLDIIFCTDVQCFLARRVYNTTRSIATSIVLISDSGRPKVLKEYYCSNNESGGMSSASTVIDIRKQLRANASRMKDVRIANRCRRTFRQPAVSRLFCRECLRASSITHLLLL